MSDSVSSADRDARIAEIEDADYIPDAKDIRRDYAWLIAELRAALSREEEAKKDAERLAHFASLLERSAGSKLEGMIEVVFAVMPPDGGSVGVAFGLNDPTEGPSALDALRNLLDESRSVSLSENG